VVKSRGIIQLSLGSCSGATAAKGIERRKNVVSPRAAAVAPIANPIFSDFSFFGVTVSAKIKRHEHEYIGGFLDYARRLAACGKTPDRIGQRQTNVHKPGRAR
jgi:hypothetical protein